MFETLDLSDRTRIRHSGAPFAAERERYLQHCFDVGCTLATRRVAGRSLLWVARRMCSLDRDGVDLARLHQIVDGADVPPAPSTAKTLINVARPWLRFLGWWRAPRQQIPSFEQLERFIAWMREERGLSASTVAQWSSRVTTFLRWCGQTGRDLATLCPEDIDAYFVTHGAPRWSRVSAGHMASMLRVFLRHAASLGACSSRLAETIRGPRIYEQESLPYALSWPDVRRVLASAESDTPRDVRDRAALMLLAVYGLRRGEVTALRLDDIDWARAQLLVRRLKRRQPQVYPLLPSMAEALGSYIDTVRPRVPYPEVFIRLHAPRRPITPPCLYDTVRRRLRDLNIKAAHLGPHALRHACAAKLLADGLTLKEIGDHLGHRSTSATRVYVKVDLDALREVGDFDLGELS
jgi:integrase/recombinase XerD